MKKYLFLAVTLLPFEAFAQDTQDSTWKDDFPIDQLTIVSEGKNPYWRLNPGRYVVLGSIDSDGSEIVVITVLDETEMVGDIETRVIEEREFKAGGLVEVSRNFFAMDKKSKDVYYFGEDVDDYEDGKVVNHSGEWRAGTDGARAGLYMPGKPVVGSRYYMEILPGVAMDRAEIYETDATVETPGGTFDRVLVVTETSPLEPGEESYKRYAPNVGMIFDDGLELRKWGRKFQSEKYVEFEIREEEMPTVPARVVNELHPTGIIKEVKVEIRRERAFYAVETFIDGKQWDVEVTDKGEVIRNKPD